MDRSPRSANGRSNTFPESKPPLQLTMRRLAKGKDSRERRDCATVADGVWYGLVPNARSKPSIQDQRGKRLIK